MNECIINFSAPKQYLKLQKNLPKPIKLNIPDWFKELEHTSLNPTIKGCVPFLETLTTGYVLELPQDFYVKLNFQKDDERQMNVVPSLEDDFECNLNSTRNNEIHPTKQLGKFLNIKKNLNFPIFKILNPWTIKTPKGYSCLFIPPLNNTDDRFEIIPGIVNTDKFEDEINFPIIFNGDKYPIQDTILKQGTPYVQIIPFKRTNWKLKLNNRDKKNRDFNLVSKILHRYKTFTWDKVVWK